MKIFRYICLFMFIVFLSSCELRPDKDSIVVSEKSFAHWKEMIKLNPEIFESEAHDAYVDIYVNELAKKAYEKRLPIYPIGAEVLKPLYGDTEKKRLARLVVMIKMQKGYDSKNGDWWYGVYDPSGTELWHKGRIQHCIDCHAVAKETDYMFSEGVMDVIETQKAFK